jgi:transposase
MHRSGRTIRRWRNQTVAWYQSHDSNDSTAAVNTLVKRVKLMAFGLRRLRN